MRLLIKKIYGDIIESITYYRSVCSAIFNNTDLWVALLIVMPPNNQQTQIILPGDTKPFERSIRLDTTLGNPIENSQILEISAFEKNQFSALTKWNQSGTLRTHPTPRYNCHGLTFASRRTGIFDSEVINKILDEDGYEEVLAKQALPGDVIIYFAADGDTEHSGIVVSAPANEFGVPKVISKWGKYAEFIHWANNCPYTFATARYYRITIKHEPTVAG